LIAYIKGNITHIGAGFCVIEAAGIGYTVCVTKTACERLKLSAETQIYTYMNVKEDGLALFGFLNAGEQEMFNTLMSVPGVGPKAAMSLLDYFTPDKIIEAVLTDDCDRLSKAQGIGRKTAQMLALRLKDKFGAVASKAQAALFTEDATEKNDAIAALTALGYSRSDALKAVLEVTLPDMTTQQIISAALRKLARR